eukprot:7975099-Heterocapsa_arctica.AAC.1
MAADRHRSGRNHHPLFQYLWMATGNVGPSGQTKSLLARTIRASRHPGEGAMGYRGGLEHPA